MEVSLSLLGTGARILSDPFFLPVRILLLQGGVKGRARTQRKELFSLAASDFRMWKFIPVPDLNP